MALVLWIVFSLTVCALLSRHPHRVVAFALATWIAIPSVGGAVVVGRGLPLHPGFWTLLCAILVLSLGGRRIVYRGLNGSLGTVALLIAFIALGALVTNTRSDSATLGFVNTFASSVLAFILIRGVIAWQQDGARKIVQGVVLLASVQAALAFAQFITGNVLFFAAERNEFYWNAMPGSVGRAVGTLDSPLDLAFFLTIAIPLTAQIRRVAVRVPIALFLAAGVALTQSRVGAAMAVAGLLYLVLRSGMSLGVRVLIVAAVGSVMAYVIYVPNPLTAGLFDRFEGSVASTDARSLAASEFFARIGDHSWIGTGFGSSGVFRDMGVLETSLENAYLMFAWDFGVPATLLLGAVILTSYIKGLRHGAARGTIAAFTLALVSAASYSGLATQSAALVLFFAVLALCAPRDLQQAPMIAGTGASEDRDSLLTRP